MAESYFFALVPRFLKTQHSFAKTVKPNTKYRLAVFKGIQKSDQMAEGVKSKIVTGKIDIESKELLFNLPYFSPTKNIQFAIKLYEQKPNEDQVEIASYNIGSTDYIRQYKAEKQTFFQVNAELKPDLSLQFDLFLEKSKELLNQALQSSSPSIPKSPREIQDDNTSQNSRQLVREGEGFISPKRKIQRKRGHEGRLRSRSRSQEKSQTLISSPRSIPKSSVSGKNLNKPTQTKTQVTKDEKKYQYQPTNNLKYSDTKEIFDIKIQKPTEIVKSPRDVQNAVKSPQPRANFTSPPQSVNSPTGALTRTGVVSPAQSKSSVLTTAPAPKSQANLNEGLEFKHNEKVFDIVPIYNVSSPKSEQRKSPGKYEPKRQPKVFEPQEDVPFVKVSKVESKNSGSLGEKESGLLLGSNLQTPIFEALTESTILITVEGQVNEPKAVIVGQEEEIQVKEKPVTKRAGLEHSKSERLIHGVSSSAQESVAKNPQKSSLEDRKYEAFYAIFFVVSIFLIYLAMSPSRRV